MMGAPLVRLRCALLALGRARAGAWCFRCAGLRCLALLATKLEQVGVRDQAMVQIARACNRVRSCSVSSPSATDVTIDGVAHAFAP